MEFRHKITVFTPTYNRSKTLERLYNSLKIQTFTDFEWLIIDDGSTDNTEQLIKKFIDEKKINIKYSKKINEGKHIAVKEGAKLAEGEFFFIVDSDDMLTENSLETISDYEQKLDANLAGFFFRMINFCNQELIGDSFPSEEFISNHVHKTFVLNIKGDLAEVLKTSVLRSIDIPKIEGEKFCAESLFLNRIAKQYNSLYVNKAIYVAEYLPDGLTSKTILNRRNSPTYATLIYKELAEFDCLSVFKKTRTYCNYWRFAFYTKRNLKENIKFINYKPLGLLCLFISLPIIFRDSFVLREKSSNN